MDRESIKQKLQEHITNNLKGKVHKITPKETLAAIGRESFDYIKSVMSLELQMVHYHMICCFLSDVYTQPICKCGEPTKFNTDKKKYATYCSNKCRFENIEESVAVRKHTNLEKYGHTNVLASEYGRSKIEATNLEKYGYTNHTKGQKYKEKVCGRKNSPEHNLNTGLGLKRIFYNSLDTRFPTISALFQFEDYNGVSNCEDRYPWMCKDCNTKFNHTLNNRRAPICPTCKPTGTKYEVLFKSLLTNWDVPYSYRNRKILPSGKELDIYIEKYKVGIETCGLYWHCSANEKIDKLTHFNKSKECEESGIKLFTIFDDEMMNDKKRKIAISLVKKSVFAVERNINAKKCNIMQLSEITGCGFHDKYNISGYKYANFNYGLIYKNRLVAAMSFYATEDGGLVIQNYSTINNFNIISAFNQFIGFITEEYGPKYICYVVDRRWPITKDLKRNHFEFIKTLDPEETYTKNWTERFTYQEIVNKGDESTDWDIIDDCGYDLWVYSAHEYGYQFDDWLAVQEELGNKIETFKTPANYTFDKF